MKEFCTFYLGPYFCGVEVQKIQEVIPPTPITKVPFSRSDIGGLINVRGTIVTALEIRSLFSLPKREEQEKYMNVILKYNEDIYALMIDAAGGIVHVQAQQFEDIPDGIDQKLRGLIKGVYKLSDKLLLELDIESLISPK
ncbi:chemotaxis protein CheW [bacterium]|nr:chemotaxis protein CheW [bacterium]